ncbi:tRNA (adenosine(37)-N6)-threonylcarbamoyltransferase complex transferase subunit TsaD [Tindallia californiensis]|uniref:N(6)-L-threonylcarbamoyladenine synthase n=1 Tax=Tindallia californiensis TaxID=159292 RepID=A0A1H3NJL4_9FIRM|nr:hypothetical protein [Tindallia californiensis]SDY89126.1 N6-L-threonylcarbamoyladenine synthase [Tindallia californiensis]
MIKKEIVMGFDTSNYTTSVALMNMDGTSLASKRVLLSTPKGQRGLRQSDAFFQHVNVLPEIMQELKPSLKNTIVKAIGASVVPRPVTGSYMPVFLAGESIARSMSSLLGVPFYSFSHQEGHIAAGLWSANLDYADFFCSLHLSGGTTELLEVTPGRNAGYNIDILGNTNDISVGQLIDRVGVSLNCDFPSGPQLEKLALEWTDSLIPIPGGVKGLELNLSGPETFLHRMVDESENTSRLAHSMFVFLGEAIALWLNNHHALKPIPMLLIVGGVAANSIFRETLTNKVNPEIKLIYADPQHCSDNALGISHLALRQFLYNKDE